MVWCWVKLSVQRIGLRVDQREKIAPTPSLNKRVRSEAGHLHLPAISLFLSSIQHQFAFDCCKLSTDHFLMNKRKAESFSDHDKENNDPQLTRSARNGSSKENKLISYAYKLANKAQVCNCIIFGSYFIIIYGLSNWFVSNLYRSCLSAAQDA